ncbi:MAG: DUF1801 domain-containing protein [Pyrinomonadaceae bacterium MAG19_C2-C3]|nr:DUF1801 domain-containing protein [Pyrinomonadaceae bacterium MAG19_C2-C3]
MPNERNSYEGFLANLPAERLVEIVKVWDTVRQNIPAGYSEHADTKFLTFKAGDEIYVALANQKNYISLYLMCAYLSPELRTKLETSGKRLKMGKSCINFTKADEMPLDVIGEIVATYDVESYLAQVRQPSPKESIKRA